MKSENFTYFLEKMKTIEFKMLATFEDMLIVLLYFVYCLMLKNISHMLVFYKICDVIIYILYGQYSDSPFLPSTNI